MTAQATPRHRVSTTTARMRDLVGAVADASVWSMDPVEAGATLVELTRLAAQVGELQARVAAHADTIHVGQDVGASSAANWLAHTTKTTRAAAYGAVRLGHDLEAHASTREALAAGEICVERARVVIRWVDRLPADLGPETREKAETHLLAEARHHDAKALSRLGRRLWEVIAPGEADAHEAEILQRQEAAALRACSLTMVDDGDGKTCGRFTLPTYHAAALRKMLIALAAPKHLAATHGPGIERRPGPEALGRALCELIERYPTERLPQTGGVNATLLVVIDEDTLYGRLEKAGVLDTGDRISPGMARRLACEASIIPAVLGSNSVPLDLGRRSRYHTEHQRIAMFLRDHGCRAEGCDRSTGLHAHHQTRWTDGGHTNLTDSASLCAWHHTLIHDPAYVTTYLPTGKIRFHRRT
ncbi:HNH endonuclease [Nocardioides sp. LMS-CY]|uniref:HNH endonuclease signature motif containing protein n=1 Tax=Nocardioides sp. (strain LMS-CY) TaxID=2840457 RepID=UPI001C0044F3|nr:HNH endonuclease signature motif containing protein [Nocardioides sp. LMS-CY]QWF21427.1 HNH endonuclease [Nocardioides sp. LMS-CY]